MPFRRLARAAHALSRSHADSHRTWTSPARRAWPALAALVLASVLAALPVLAGNPEDPSILADNPNLLNRAPLTSAGPGAATTSVLFPATPQGYPGEVRDPRDVAPFLAFQKAAAMRSIQGLREEPNPAEANYDAKYYGLDINLNPSTHILTGVVTAKLQVVAGPLNQVVLDLADNMTVSGITSAGVTVTSTHASNLLTVNLERAYANGELITLVISYSGNPAGDAFGWSSQGGQPMIWTLSEAFGGRTWWPSKDYPEDKADSADVRVTTPTGLITASNGVLRQHWDNGTNSFYWWHEKHPITTYLISIASTTYNVYSDWYRYSPTDSMEIKFYNFPASIPDVLPVQAKVKNMIAAYAAKWGEYPFLDEKYGHAEFPWSGGMEHQTCTSLGYFGESVVAHELGHQWWGDMVTCKDFHHVWINEGFATYTEAIWAEANGGMSAYHAEMEASAYYGPGTIYVPDLNDWGRIFDSNLSYNKASWVLHMLRGVVGDQTFFDILRAYYNEYKYSVATTENFRDVAERVSGRDLHAFFQEWIYGESYPIYQYNWSAAPAGGGYDVTLDLNQVQTWQIFTMPIQVVIPTQAGDRTFQIQNSQAHQVYTLHVDAAPSDVRIDPDRWILRVVMAPIPTPTFERQILLVNGVDWNTYGSEITTAYQDRAFSGNYSVDFWDCFQAPAGGYPAPLPEPLGHGSVPGSILSHYKVVIWVGGAYGADTGNWNDSPMLSYMQAGGDVLLLTRMGSSYLAEPFRNYLGVTWITDGTIYDCISTVLGLTNIGRLGTQSYVSGFNMTLGPESTLLYKAVSGHNPNWGIGAIREPAGGGPYNPTGAKFAFLSGRPYRWVHADLRQNIEWLLQHKFNLPASTGTEEPPARVEFRLDPSSPNPFGREATLRFMVPSDGHVRLTIWDVAGREVRTLLDSEEKAGAHVVTWDGTGRNGRPAASGIYYARLEASGRSAEQRLIRVR